MTTKTIEARDVGPISQFKFEAPDAGVVVLHGPMGTGKSILLDAIEAATTGRGKPPVADGAERAEVRVNDVLLRVGKSSRRTGELDFEVLTGRYTLADLINPPYKDRAAKDAHAIKTAVQLAGSGDERLFWDLVGGEQAFAALGITTGAGDIVALAAAVERALQRQARDAEGRADVAQGKAQGHLAACEGIDTGGEHNATALASARDRAVSNLAGLTERAENARRKIGEAQDARRALEAAENDAGPLSTVGQAQQALDTLRGQANEQMAGIAQIERELAEARSGLAMTESAIASAEKVLTTARSHEQSLARFREVVAAAENVEPVSDQELADARAAVQATREAELHGAKIRDALANREKAEDWLAQERQCRSDAEVLREEAAGTDEVLSSLVAKLGGSLFAERGRLMVKSERGNESFWDLSDGERSEIAVTIFASHVGTGGMLALPQAFWEGLDWQGRKRIAEHCKRVGILAVTAESDKSAGASGPLRAEVFDA